ncbi:glycosyltransferase [Bradyrhizobium sp. ORS 111]|uniref:glycosyltransferase n=1 Tax=Bradyrhizobium sp. ORS 111 TaxID=1685958 RepID=UPI00388FD0F1
MQKADLLRWNGRAAPRALFVQATEPAAYPPLIHAASLLAEAGWEVVFLSAPIAGSTLTLPRHRRISAYAISPRPSHVMNKRSYAAYAAKAACLALQLQPDVVYASDVLGAGPGLLAARLANARLVYHEHDSPAPGTLPPWVARLRAAAARRAALVVFPNEARARIAQNDLGCADDQLRVVWNVPRRSELPSITPAPPDTPLLLYYHGSITPDRLPKAVIDSVRQLAGRARLRLVGYEAPGAPGYVRHLIEQGRVRGIEPVIDYAGELPTRSDILAAAAQAQIGLALVPHDHSDLNLRHMTGASNKPYDYMAAGLALLVSDLPDWRAMFITRGYGLGCDPTDPQSIGSALQWFIDHPVERQAMGMRGRSMIEQAWNYDTEFSSLLAALSGRASQNL